MHGVCRAVENLAWNLVLLTMMEKKHCSKQAIRVVAHNNLERYPDQGFGNTNAKRGDPDCQGLDMADLINQDFRVVVPTRYKKPRSCPP